MAGTDTLFAGSIPDVYEHLFVPLLFESHAVHLAERVARLEPRRLLEVAAGTGVVTRAMSERLDGGTHIVATDLNPAMLARAEAAQPASDLLEWQQADALALPFADASFDVVVCQFGVMFFPDKVKGYAEAHRVLRRGGRLLFNVWDRIEQNEFDHVVTEALAGLYPDDPPRFLERVPHGYFDVARIRREVLAAGFSEVSIDVRTDTSRGGSAREVATAICMGTPLRNELEARAPTALEAATEVATKAITKRFGDGPVEGRMRAYVIEATA